jgi:hypothetical protein
MTTLTEVKSKTDHIFECMKVTQERVPVPPQIWNDKLEALTEAKLDQHRSALIFDMRKWQAKEMGFEEISSSTMVKMLMGEEHTETDEGERQVYEWCYDHHDDVVLDKKENWGGKSTIFNRVVRKGLWYMPPFSKVKVWSVQFGKLNYLKRDIPYGVVLRINECKELKLFNVFQVLAPMEAWEKKTDIDPIVVASIWEMPPKIDEKSGRTAGQVAHFFLAQW